MKKMLLILGIISLIACVLFLLLAALSWYGYYHALDGSAELFARLQRRMLTGLAGGAVSGVLGAVCLLLRGKL